MMPLWKPWPATVRRHALALGLLAALTLVFVWPVTLGVGQIPRGGGDLASLLWPKFHYAAQALRSGRLPLWNPTLFAGEPLALENEVGFFYPPNLLMMLLWPALPYAAMEWLAALHLWVAGAAMYGLMQALLAEPAESSAAFWPGLLAGVGYMFSDVFITHIGNLNINAVAAWLPAAFAALHLALTRRSTGWALAAGLMAGLAVLAGHAQMTYIVAAALAAYALWETARSAWSQGRRPAVGVARLALLAGVTAAGVGAASLLPTLELAPLTARIRLTYADAASYAIPWAGLAGLFSPLVFGRGAADFWGPWDRVELGYLGVLPLFFAGLAPLRGGRGLPAFLALLAGGALLVALGGQTPVHAALYAWLPGMSSLRVPARFILLADFALAALAGYGLRALGSWPRRRVLAWAAGLAAAAAAVMLLGLEAAGREAGRPWPAASLWGVALALLLVAAGAGLALWGRPPAAALAVCVLAADLVALGAGVEVDFQPATRGFERSAAVDFVVSQPGPTRVDTASGLVASSSALYGLENIAGVPHALQLAGYQTYLGAMGPRGSRLYDFLNVQWILAAKGQPPAADPTIVPVFADDPGLDVYLNTEAQPRVTLVSAAHFVPDGQSALAAVLAPDFDPARQVVIESGREARAAWPAAGPSGLDYQSYAPEYYRIAVTAPGPAYLVFSEIWYPGWLAWVDGQPAAVERANLVFRAVRVAGPGDHVVEMRYVPVSLYVGLALSAATLAGIAGWAALRRRPARLAQP